MSRRHPEKLCICKGISHTLIWGDPRLALSMQEWFLDFVSSPVFTSLVPILDFNLCPKEQESLSWYCDEEILKLSNHFEALLQLNQCVVISIPNESDVLKAYVLPMLTSIDSIDYLQTWFKLFKNKDIMSNCSNVLQIIELLLIMPFSNTKLERIFSWMNQVKTDFHDWLGQKRLETLLLIGEEGPEIKISTLIVILARGIKTKYDGYLLQNHTTIQKKENVHQPQMALWISLVSHFQT